jgi:acyl-CoA hydrolase
MFERGERIFLPGSSGEPSSLVALVLAAPAVAITTSFVPGINDFAGRHIGDATIVTGFFMQPALAGAQRVGSFRHLPLSYAGIVKWLDETEPFDTCVVQVSPPDRKGICSLGPAAEFTPIVLRRARRVIAVVNSNLPYFANAPKIELASCTVQVAADTPIIGYDTGPVDEAACRIAGHVAAFIGDDVVLQLGLGKVPAGILARLGDRRGLKLHSGMLSDGVMALQASGALACNAVHRTTVLLGPAPFYRWAADRSDIAIVPCDKIHAAGVLSSIERFVAINSALEVDLFGQCNLELASGRAVSGVGGALDFARAARLSRDGLSIVALPATFGNGKGSRIKPVLGSDALVSVPRTDVDVVVTEEGAADLRGRSVYERAEAIIEIASSQFKGELRVVWAQMQKRL